MNVTEVLRERATPGCSECGGTGIIEGRVYGEVTGAWWKGNDRVCDCVGAWSVEGA